MHLLTSLGLSAPFENGELMWKERMLGTSQQMTFWSMRMTGGGEGMKGGRLTAEVGATGIWRVWTRDSGIPTVPGWCWVTRTQGQEQRPLLPWRRDRGSREPALCRRHAQGPVRAERRGGRACVSALGALGSVGEQVQMYLLWTWDKGQLLSWGWPAECCPLGWGPGIPLLFLLAQQPWVG